MTKAIHGSFTVERVYDASPARVFKAFADPASKARWFVGPGGWQEIKRELDFRPGGQEIAHGKFPNGPETKFVARYHEIVRNERLVYVYDMHVDGVFMSVSLATIELTPQGSKTELRITEQAVFIDGHDGNESRREGTKYLLEQIAANLPD
ncbi:SRPBCC family protein [Methylocystis sp. IM3]|uniref:SRPBCC family protein n=1 Tax=unclassified Methylocystis TaxID=2625913 RepID=UPI0030F58966